MKALESPVWDFTEDEWAAIDRGVRKAYWDMKGGLPSFWKTLDAQWIDGDGNRHFDPAGAFRSIGYEYAAFHPGEIHGHDAWEITETIGNRVRQHVRRDLNSAKNLRAIPADVGEDFDQNMAVVLRTQNPITTPILPPDHDAYLESFDQYGKFYPQDQLEFMVERRRGKRVVYTSREVMDELHTREPTAEERQHAGHSQM